MLLEVKAGSIALTTFLLSIPLILLQAMPANIDIFHIADKAGVIGILLYMSYTLNKRMEKMFEDFQLALKDERASQKEEREKADKNQSELLNIIIKLSTNEKQ
jgi:hypothetical protein